jgi:transcriptional regulator with XRE-family HTH domain
MAEIIPLPLPSAPARKDPEPLWRELLGDQLRRARHDRDETLTALAERAGISPQYLSEIERGVKEPSSEMIAAVAGALDLTLVDLTSSVAEHLRATGERRSAQARCRASFALAA